jgi:Putative prokaryotic signal transducing protein
MKLVTVYTAFNPAQAHLMRSRLEASDFLVNVKNENAALGMDGYGMAVGGIQVQVPEDQVEDARDLIRSCEDASEDASET